MTANPELLSALPKMFFKKYWKVKREVIQKKTGKGDENEETYTYLRSFGVLDGRVCAKACRTADKDG